MRLHRIFFSLSFLAGLFLLPLACGSSPNSFTFSWKLVDISQADPVTAPALSCAAANVGTIRLVLSAQGNPAQPITVDFPCGSVTGQGQETTAPESPDNYTIQALALSPAGQSASQLSFTADNSSGPTDLGLIIFQIMQ